MSDLSIIDLQKRRLTLLGDVGEDMLLKTLLGLDALEKRNRSRGITIVLSTFGGIAYDALAIYDRIRHSPCPITIVGVGAVMSSGTIILQAAKNRYLAPNCRFMVHYGTTSINSEEKVTDAINALEFEKTVDQKTMEDIYLRRMKKKNRATIKKLLSTDSFMTAAQAVEYGFADAVKIK
jgi:ATP-dependent Clp protease protease subunit